MSYRQQHNWDFKDALSAREFVPFEPIQLFGHDHLLGRSPENDFTKSRPYVGGPCHPTGYRLGQLYLLFLSPSDARWFLSEYFRENEEVSGSDARWVTAVRHYIRISSLGDYEQQRQLLEDLREQAISKVEAATLASWFCQHPLPEALPLYQRLQSSDPSRSNENAIHALACLGDKWLVDWAIGALDDEQAWEVLLRSPTEKAQSAFETAIEDFDRAQVAIESAGPWLDDVYPVQLRSLTHRAVGDIRLRQLLAPGLKTRCQDLQVQVACEMLTVLGVDPREMSR